MLHESAGRNSATRNFRGEPVLSWTIDRLSRCERLDAIAVLCWEDQAAAIEPIAGEGHADMLVKGPRQTIPSIEAVAAAQKFADGWRGGLLSTCEFDVGFYAPWFNEIAQHHEADAIIAIDPASGLVDFEIIDDTIAEAEEREECEILFTQAAPGLAGADPSIAAGAPVQGGDSSWPAATLHARPTLARSDRRRRMRRRADAGRAHHPQIQARFGAAD